MLVKEIAVLKYGLVVSVIKQLVILLNQQLLKQPILIMQPCVRNYLGQYLPFMFTMKINLKKP